jgi:hypothetical protein
LLEIRNKDDQAVDVAPGSGHVVKIPMPGGTDVGAIDAFAMLVRYLPRDSAEPA